jgi:hypothetical protein
MLDHFGRSELDALVASEGGPHVSIYIPTHQTVIEAEQDSLRLKNLTKEAEKQLTENWMRATEAREFLSPVVSLIHDDSFWMQRQNGLAIFLSKDDFRTYRLGLSFAEHLSICHSYTIRPIIPVLQSHAHGYVLALSANNVVLYEVSEYGMLRMEVPGMPESLVETLNYVSVDRGQQSHSGSATRQRKRVEVFHGQGGEPDSHKEELQNFFRAVDAGVCARIKDSGLPLIVACVDSSFPIYREVQSYSALHREHISGNVDHLDLDKLYKKSVPVLQSETRQRTTTLACKIRELLDTPVASDKVSDVIQASYQGRVRVLFFDEHAIIQGRFNPLLQLPVAIPDGSRIEFSPYNVDLVESAVEQTILHRGDVYSVSQTEMPGREPLAALFRY